MFDIEIRNGLNSVPAATDPGMRPDALHPADASDELIAILCRIDQLEAQAAAALARMNDAAKWRRRGYTSATAFLKHRAGYTPGRALGLVTRSNALTAMPLSRAHFERGDLSIDQVDVLVGAYNFNKAAFTADEAMLVGLAVQLPLVRELWQLVEYWKQRIDPQLVEEHQDMLNSLRGIRLRRADRLMELATASMDRPELLVHVSYDKLIGSDASIGSSATAAANPPVA